MAIKRITLTKGAEAVVDGVDYAKLSRYKWTYNPKTGYAYRRKMQDGKYICIYMHRAIMNPTAKKVVDHKNRNKLDNRRSNLRVGTQRQNLANTGAHKLNTSGYKGVISQGKKWVAQMYHRQNGRRRNIYIGAYHTKEEAAKAYDKKAQELHGEFAFQNFPGRIAS